MNHSGIVTGISYTGETTYRCENCAKKDAEILELRLQLANEQTGNAELKTKFEAADVMNRELHNVNDELQKKLAAETKRADVAEERANKLSRNSHVGQREVFHELKSRLKL